MFLIKPEEIRNLDKAKIKQIQNTIHIICWAYIDWQKCDNLDLVRLNIQISSYPQWRPPFLQIYYHPINRKRRPLPNYIAQDDAIKLVLSKVLGQVVLHTCALNLEEVVNRPTEIEHLLAIGSYKPVFEELLTT